MQREKTNRSDKPDVGDERIVLYPEGKKLVLKQEMWTQAEGQFTTFWNEEDKDFVTWPGGWIEAETLGRFDTQDEVLEFLKARMEAKHGVTR